jgi:hypothetical protein
MGFTKPEVQCQIFTDDDVKGLLTAIDTTAMMKGIFEVRGIIRQEAGKRGIEIFNDQDLGFKDCADENGIPCGKDDCLMCACPF